MEKEQGDTCSYTRQYEKSLKCIALLMALLVVLMYGNVVNAAKVEVTGDNFPDSLLRKALSENYGTTDSDGKEYIDSDKITSLNINDGYVENLKGIDLLTELTDICLSYNGNILKLNNPKLNNIIIYSEADDSIEIDVPSIEMLHITGGGKLRSIDISKDTKLNELIVDANDSITAIKGLESLEVLKELTLRTFPAVTVDLSKLNELEELTIKNSKIQDIDVSKLSKLKGLYITENDISGIKLGDNSNLESVLCIGNPKLTSLDISKCKAIESMRLIDNNLTTLDVSKCKNLWSLSVDGNKLTKLNVNKCKDLAILSAKNNELSDINVSKCEVLLWLSVNGNKKLKQINLTKNKNLKILDVGNTAIRKINVSKNKMLYELSVCNTKIKRLDLSKNKELREIKYYGSKVKKPIFPDFKYMYIGYDVKAGGKINVKNITDMGYKYKEKSKYVSYNRKKHTITVAKNTPVGTYEDYEDLETYQLVRHTEGVVFKKGKKKIIISILVE